MLVEWYLPSQMSWCPLAYPGTIDQRTLQEETALYLATCREHLDCLLSLLQAGAEPDISNKSRETPLYKGKSLGWTSHGPGKPEAKWATLSLFP